MSIWLGKTKCFTLCSVVPWLNFVVPLWGFPYHFNSESFWLWAGLIKYVHFLDYTQGYQVLFLCYMAVTLLLPEAYHSICVMLFQYKLNLLLSTNSCIESDNICTTVFNKMQIFLCFQDFLSTCKLLIIVSTFVLPYTFCILLPYFLQHRSCNFWLCLLEF